MPFVPLCRPAEARVAVGDLSRWGASDPSRVERQRETPGVQRETRAWEH